MTIKEVKEYEIKQFVKAFYDGDEKAWTRYRRNVKRVVNKFNKEHEEQVSIDMIMR